MSETIWIIKVAVVFFYVIICFSELLFTIIKKNRRMSLGSLLNALGVFMALGYFGTLNGNPRPINFFVFLGFYLSTLIYYLAFFYTIMKPISNVLKRKRVS